MIWSVEQQVRVNSCGKYNHNSINIGACIYWLSGEKCSSTRRYYPDDLI